MARLLLAHNDVDPDKPDGNDQTPPGCASLKGHDQVVRLLLTRDDVDPNKLANYGKTPLWDHSLNGRKGVAIPLLSRDVHPEKLGEDGGTPL